MTDAFKINEARKIAEFDLTRLPATVELVRPSEARRGNLIAAVSGVFGLALFAAAFWLEDYLGTTTMYGVAATVLLLGGVALLVTARLSAVWNLRKLVTIGDTYVEITRWPILGSRKLNHVSLTEYTGVSKRFVDLGEGVGEYIVELIHDDASLDVVLYGTAWAAAWDDKWRYYAERLNLPAIDQGHVRKKAAVGGTPAFRIMPGAVFTLDMDDIPAAAVFDNPPGDQLSVFALGLGLIGLSVSIVWTNCCPLSNFFKTTGDALFVLVPFVAGLTALYFAAKIHRTHRTVLIDRTHVTGARWGLLGTERWVEPLSAFLGLRGSAGKETVASNFHSKKEMRYSIALVHPDHGKSITLYRAAHEGDLSAKLQYYANRLGVPVLLEKPG